MIISLILRFMLHNFQLLIAFRANYSSLENIAWNLRCKIIIVQSSPFLRRLMEVGQNEKKEYGKGGIKKRRDRIEEQEIRKFIFDMFYFLITLKQDMSQICIVSVLSAHFSEDFRCSCKFSMTDSTLFFCQFKGLKYLLK